MQFTLDEIIQAEKNAVGSNIRIYLKPNPSLRTIPDTEIDPNTVCLSTVVGTDHSLYQAIVEKFQINLE